MHAICQAIMSPMDKPKHALNPNPKNVRKMRTNSDQWGQQRSHQTIQKQQLVSNWGYWRGFPAKSTSVSLSLTFPKAKVTERTWKTEERTAMEKDCAIKSPSDHKIADVTICVHTGLFSSASWYHAHNPNFGTDAAAAAGSITSSSRSCNPLIQLETHSNLKECSCIHLEIEHLTALAWIFFVD